MASYKYEEEKQEKVYKKVESVHAQAEKFQNLGDAQLDLEYFDDAANSYLTSAKLVSQNPDLLAFFQKVGFRYTSSSVKTTKGFEKKQGELSLALQNYFSK
jgi:hypothetical protein